MGSCRSICISWPSVRATNVMAFVPLRDFSVKDGVTLRSYFRRFHQARSGVMLPRRLSACVYEAFSGVRSWASVRRPPQREIAVRSKIIRLIGYLYFKLYAMKVNKHLRFVFFWGLLFSVGCGPA